MALWRKSTLCCLLLSALMVLTVSSFSVDELCNRRCHRGRGGVLCNCNARHFTGKRSSLLEDENVYVTGSKTHTRNSKFQHENNREKPADILGSISFSSRGRNSDDIIGQEEQHVDNSWHRKEFENILNNLHDKSGSNTIKHIGKNDEVDTSNILTKSNDVLPILYIEQNRNNDKEDNADVVDDDVMEEAKQEIASKVKEIIAGPYLNLGQDVADHLHEDEEVDNDDEIVPRSKIQRHKLIQLQQVLRRALHAR